MTTKIWHKNNQIKQIHQKKEKKLQLRYYKKVQAVFFRQKSAILVLEKMEESVTKLELINLKYP